MKKIMLLSVVVLFVLEAHAERISHKAWCRLRDIHAHYVQDAEKGSWKPEEADTDAFLENNLKGYVLGLADDNKRLKAEIDRLENELEQIQSGSNSYLAWTVILGIMLFLVFAAPAVFIAATRKKGDRRQLQPNSGCPRCGSPIDLSTKKCTKCGTHI